MAMYVARLQFGRARKEHQEDADHAVHGYLAALWKNGQACEYMVAETDARWQAFLEIPRPNSLERRFFSSWVSTELKTVVNTFGRAPRTSVFDSDRRRFPSWRRAKTLYLFTTALDRASPICSPELDLPIPLYLLPLDPSGRQGILFWADSYRHHDHLWLSSGALETKAYRQVADPHSALSAEGREHCSRIEAATGKPTYYYLIRHYGRRSRENERPCPVCGGRWAVRHKTGVVRRFSDFDFSCRKCRLISHVGSSREDERRARIGEFRR